MERHGISTRDLLQERGIDYDGIKQIILQEAIENREILPYRESFIENTSSQDEINRMMMLFVTEMINEGVKLSDLKEALDGAKSYIIEYQAQRMKEVLGQ